MLCTGVQPHGSTRKLISSSSSFHRLDMTLAVAEALTPNKPNQPPPECIPCNCPLTIKHLLIECVDFNDVRQRFYQVPSLQDLFNTVKPEVILDFLKAAALYRLLWVFFKCLTFMGLGGGGCLFPHHMTVWSTNMFSPWRWPQLPTWR